jgi:hypothetical protein
MLRKGSFKKSRDKLLITRGGAGFPRRPATESMLGTGLSHCPFIETRAQFFASHNQETGFMGGRMSMVGIIAPFPPMLVSLAGWIDRQQQEVIAYLQEENEVLDSRLKGKRIRFTDDERRRLAVKGKILGRRVLIEFVDGQALARVLIDKCEHSQGPSIMRVRVHEIICPHVVLMRWAMPDT